MKLVVLDARGLTGTKVVTAIRGCRHEGLAASPDVSVNGVTGEGLTQASAGAQVVIDVANPLSCRDPAALELVEESCLNVISAASAAHVTHHVAPSEVGTGLVDSAYFRAYAARESLIETSPVPHTILRSTQFLEYMDRLDGCCVRGQTIRAVPACVQQVLCDEVAAALADVAISFPGTARPIWPSQNVYALTRWSEDRSAPRGRCAKFVTDPRACYFGAKASDEALIPGDDAIIGVTDFEDWLTRSAVSEALVQL
jgi:hypothetical protein